MAAPAGRSNTNPLQLGNETRSSVAPVSQETGDVNTLGPPYDYAGELPTPLRVGVREGNSLGSVFDAVKGAMFYVDMIGFGASGNRFTRGMGQFPMGVNYFIKAGTKCSNGAEMYTYVEGIPKGDILGTNVQAALREQNLPGLKGLAPGILEDARDALNPLPVVNTLMGTGYAKCKQETKPVGDHKGSLSASDGVVWIPRTPDIKSGPGGRPLQTKWVLDRWITQEEYANEIKNAEYCPDGFRKSDHSGGDCSKPVSSRSGFVGSLDSRELLLPTVLLLALTASLGLRYLRK
jgi:hypothetical protein